ncbi:MAG: type II toxin-antitoxin system RelE family toxin [Hassallia sp.]
MLNETLLQRIKAVIEEVENAENLGNVSSIKKLKADGDYYRFRVGDYRIGITVSESVVIFASSLAQKRSLQVLSVI